MRWILFSAIFLNLLYFGWHQWLRQGTIGDDIRLAPVESIITAEMPKLKLLSERRAHIEVPALKAHIAPLKPNNIADIVSEQVATSKRCPAAGPFKNLDSASEFLLKLVGRGIRAELSEVSLEQSNDTWVIIPPLKGRRSALRKLRELQAKGIDSYIITQGRLTNAISLGLFKQYQSALGVQTDMKKVGYDTVLEKHLRQSTEYWVQIGASENEKNIEKQIMDLLRARSTLKFTQTLCE